MKPLVISLVFGLLAASGTVVTFDSAQLGKAPEGWTVAMTNGGGAPRWEIRKDTTAPTQPYVLAQTSNDTAGDRCPLAIFDALSVRDVDVSVRIKPVAGHENQAGGVVWRYRDPNNYYVARENALTKNVAIYRVVNGASHEIANAVPHDIEPNTWHILKVTARGDRFQVYLNHRRILQAQDKTFRAPGKVGVWTSADSITYFDDFRVYPR
jgi:hypothetical protein